MSDEPLVRAENVSKKFCRSLKRSLWYGMKDLGGEVVGLSGRNRLQLRKDEFLAIDNVSFELRRGECLGLIGRNGAGKSTLLRMLNGLVRPDAGRVTVRGRVGALIELGVGFNPILTGRENIFVNGAVLGLTKKEMDRKFEEIVEFAEIGEFIDTPVQSYSSGMRVRLGFAVAAHLDPDVLLIDEVLAVGDAGFRARCYNQIFKLSQDCAVIFVSHSPPQVSRLCNRLLLLREGRPEALTSDVAKGLQAFSSRLGEAPGQLIRAPGSVLHSLGISWSGGSGGANQLECGSAVDITVDMSLPNAVGRSVECSIGILDSALEVVGQGFSGFSNQNIPWLEERQEVRIHLDSLALPPGSYFFGFSAYDAESREILLWDYAGTRITVAGDFFVGAPMVLLGDWTSTRSSIGALHPQGVDGQGGPNRYDLRSEP